MTAGPAARDALTDEILVGVLLSQSMFNLHTASVTEGQRLRANEAMARAFDKVDFVIAATNPGPAFAADATMSSPSSSFVDWAKANAVAQLGFRGVMAGVRFVGRPSRSCRRRFSTRSPNAFPTSSRWARSR